MELSSSILDTYMILGFQDFRRVASYPVTHATRKIVKVKGYLCSLAECNQVRNRPKINFYDLKDQNSDVHQALVYV